LKIEITFSGPPARKAYSLDSVARDKCLFLQMYFIIYIFCYIYCQIFSSNSLYDPAVLPDESHN
jgi:hypothetical protein